MFQQDTENTEIINKNLQNIKRRNIIILFRSIIIVECD